MNRAVRVLVFTDQDGTVYAKGFFERDELYCYVLPGYQEYFSAASEKINCSKKVVEVASVLPGM